jgi:uncharacterized phage protein (TIGR01671 family)
MREILFRGKKKDGEWVEGDLLHWNKFYCIVEWDAKVEDINVANMRVIPETVGQYTGLNDKNGKKIFEGDILKLWQEKINKEDEVLRVRVEFGNPNHLYNWGFQIVPIGKFRYNKDILCWVETEDDIAFCEVIGNIHDNPELLEVPT